MPANASAGSVFIDQHLREGFGGPARKDRNLFAQRQQKVGDRRRLHHFVPVIVVAQAKADDASVCQMAMEIERLEGQAFEMPGEFRFVPWCYQFRLIDESFGEILGTTKEIALAQGYSGCF